MLTRARDLCNLLVDGLLDPLKKLLIGEICELTVKSSSSPFGRRELGVVSSIEHDHSSLLKSRQVFLAERSEMLRGSHIHLTIMSSPEVDRVFIQLRKANRPSVKLEGTYHSAQLTIDLLPISNPLEIGLAICVIFLRVLDSGTTEVKARDVITTEFVKLVQPSLRERNGVEEIAGHPGTIDDGHVNSP